MTKRMLRLLVPGTAAHVVAHAEKRMRRGMEPMIPYGSIKDPKRALLAAKEILGLQEGAPLISHCKMIIPKLRVIIDSLRRNLTDMNVPDAYLLFPCRQGGVVGEIVSVAQEGCHEFWYVRHEKNPALIGLFHASELFRHPCQRPDLERRILSSA